MNRLTWMSIGALPLIVAAPAAFASDWLSFTNQTSSRIVAAPGLSTTDQEEKDYAWGDLDQDGWIDLVAVRKTPFTTYGKRANVFFHNENGVLVDRTAQFFSASDVAGDQGFLTPTNDRDVFVADVNNDGWLDVITSVTLSQPDPKAISHPRVYINLGENEQGAWLGVRYEEARIPELPMDPNFCGLGVGDVTGDGYVDMYMTDYNSNLEDRLFINAGPANPGFFSDQSNQRVTNALWLQSSFGSSSTISDMNGDGWKDIVKSGNGPVRIIYNGGSGFFTGSEQVYGGAAYFASTGDLNNDGKLEIIVSDDNIDVFMRNTGNGADSFANFTNTNFPATTNGFGSQSITIDLDFDGNNDVVIADVDVDAPGCTRVTDILRNNGVTPNVGFTSDPANIPNSALTGVHHTAIFDLNNDGALDIILGKCAGMQVWMGTPPAPICASDLNNDSIVDGADLGAMLLEWGHTNSPADLTGDNIVNGADLGILLLAWGPCL